MKVLGKMGEDPVVDIAAFLDVVIVIAELFQQVKEHGKGVLRNGFGRIAGHIAPGYPTAFQIVFIQIIGTRGGDADQL